MRRSELNDALWAAMARGERPFRCWTCQGWFVETGTIRTCRLVCDDPACKRARARYMAFGLMPGEPFPETEGQRERSMMARAVLRAIEADWLSDKEIAEDLGCPSGFVNRIRTRHGLNKFRRSA